MHFFCHLVHHKPTFHTLSNWNVVDSRGHCVQSYSLKAPPMSLKLPEGKCIPTKAIMRASEVLG